MHHYQIYLHILYSVVLIGLGGYLSYKYQAHVQAIAKEAAVKAIAEVKKL